MIRASSMAVREVDRRVLVADHFINRNKRSDLATGCRGEKRNK
jgi:hypothetical protein